MYELNRKKGERRKVHVSFTRTFFVSSTKKKTEEGGGEGNKEEEHHRHQLSINQLKKPPCLVIALVYDDMSSRSAH
jgi:hypothetical protein